MNFAPNPFLCSTLANPSSPKYTFTAAPPQSRHRKMYDPPITAT